MAGVCTIHFNDFEENKRKARRLPIAMRQLLVFTRFAVPSKAQFKRRISRVSNLIPILVH